MDKIGPMCRSVEDCALVFNAIYGPDGRDDTVVDAPFAWNPGRAAVEAEDRLHQVGVRARQNAGRPGGGRGEPAAREGAAAAGRGRGGLSPEEQRARDEARLKLLNEALDVYRKAGATLQPIELPATDIAARSASS